MRIKITSVTKTLTRRERKKEKKEKERKKRERERERDRELRRNTDAILIYSSTDSFHLHASGRYLRSFSPRYTVTIYLMILLDSIIFIYVYSNPH